MNNARHLLMQWVVLVTLVGSLGLAIVDSDHRGKFMSIASASLGAFWALHGATDD